MCVKPSIIYGMAVIYFHRPMLAIDSCEQALFFVVDRSKRRPLLMRRGAGGDKTFKKFGNVFCDLFMSHSGTSGASATFD
jgi:hypothetical protein